MRQRARWGLGIAACAVFALLALQVALHGPLTRIDLRIAQYVAAHRVGWLTPLMQLATSVHQTGKLLAAAVLLAAWRWSRGARRQALAFAVVPGGELLNLLLKQVFQRPRPSLAAPFAQLGTFSFPSGHAVACTVFYGAACALVFGLTRSRAWRALAVVVAVAMVALVAASRIYLGAHYLSDVLAGIAVGCACLAPIMGRSAEGP